MSRIISNLIKETNLKDYLLETIDVIDYLKKDIEEQSNYNLIIFSGEYFGEDEDCLDEKLKIVKKLKEHNPNLFISLDVHIYKNLLVKFLQNGGDYWLPRPWSSIDIKESLESIYKKMEKNNGS
jgi:hypothetical protein